MADPSQGTEIGLGTVLGGTYQVAALLGKGGMGSVYAATHMRLPGKKFAIKVLHGGQISEESYARFRREAEIASRIGHPNIIEVIDWNTLPDGTPYLVLEYLSGEPLSARLARGPMPPDDALGLVRQIGSALAAAHRAGIVHRDLKPDNIFLCPTDSGGHVTDHVKVLDFGISKIKNSTTLQTQEARLLGTPQYMAPEQASGKNKEVDHRTDVFALGAIVYEMLSGRPAFAGDNLAQVVYKVVFEEPQPLQELVPGLPPTVVRSINQALAKDPGARFPDVQTFVADLTGRPLFTLNKVSAQPAVAFEATMDSANPGFAHTAAAMPVGTGSRPLASGSMPATPLPTPAVAAPPPPAKKKSRLGLVLGLVLIAGGAAAGIGVAMTRKGAETPSVAQAPPEPPKPPPPEPPPPVTHKAPEPPKPPEPTAEAPKPPEPIKPLDSTKPPVTHKAETKPKPKPPEEKAKPAPAVEPDEPAPSMTDLIDAERALREGNFDETIRLARRSLTVKPTDHAYMLITAGFCGKHDLSNARANLQNARGRARLRALRTCKSLDFPLQ